jgi:hypothetical protein
MKKIIMQKRAFNFALVGKPCHVKQDTMRYISYNESVIIFLKLTFAASAPIVERNSALCFRFAFDLMDFAIFFQSVDRIGTKCYVDEQE